MANRGGSGLKSLAGLGLDEIQAREGFCRPRGVPGARRHPRSLERRNSIRPDSREGDLWRRVAGLGADFLFFGQLRAEREISLCPEPSQGTRPGS